MERQEVEQLLQELGDELARLGFETPVRIMIFGGVYMLLEVQNRASTHDIDIVLLDMPDTTEAVTPENRAFREAVRTVAKKRKLPRNWLNDDGAVFAMGFTPDPQARLWKEFNKLAVYLPSKICIFVMKVMSFREKDRSDVEALCLQLGIHTREQAQAIIDQFVAKQWQEEYRLPITLLELTAYSILS